MPPKKAGEATASDEEVRFLLTVIKVGGLGSIDWQKVSDAAGIVSKAAANKRFSRLNTKYKDLLDGVTAAGGNEGGADSSASASPKKKAAPKSKKRKVEDAGDDDEASAVKSEIEDED